MIRSLIALTFLVPFCARAQDAPIGLFMDAVVGGGPRTQHTGDVWFRPESTPYGRLSLGITTPLRGRFAARLAFDRAGAIAPPAYGDVCRLAPDGSCEKYFRWNAVYSAGAGLRTRLGSATELEVLGGLGLTREPSRLVRVDAAWRFASHLALVVGAEHRTVRRADGNRLWWRPLFGGIRLH